jgi:NAD(P)-dependent dehydrogenase (short-subunit alcohol dehydrogenase family)
VRADVTKKEDWEKLVKFADEKFGRLDVVVNNAGTTYRNKV